MRGILIRLAESDGEAAAALKIITFFDTLSEQPGLDLNGLVTATSVLAECKVSVQLSEGDVTASHADGNDSVTPPERVDRSPNGHLVWLDRDGDPELTDPLILEQCALAVDRVVERLRRRDHAGALQDPQLLDALMDRESSQSVQRVAADRLGLRMGARVRLVAVDTNHESDPAAGALTLLARARGSLRPRNVTVREGLGAALVEDSPRRPLSDDIRDALGGRVGAQDSSIRCGISAPATLDQLALAWDQALIALKFSIHGSPEQAVTNYDGLGPVSLLAELPTDRLRTHPDVTALDHLSRGGSGQSDLKVLDVFCHTSSLRTAAQSLHMHHSSVAARILKIEQELDWAIDTAEGRFRTQLALLAHRLVSP